MRIQSIAAVVLLGLLVSTPSLAKSKAVDAEFERSEPAAGLMTLTEEGEAWRVTFQAGGIPNGDATAADCELEAVGPKDMDDVIAARLVPFEGEINMLTEADIGPDAPVIEVRIGPEGAFVTDSGAAARHCGMGSDIDGFYKRTGSFM